MKISIGRVETRFAANAERYAGFFATLLQDESGQDLIEYALIFCFVMLGAVASLRSVATSVGSVFAGVGSVLTTAL